MKPDAFLALEDGAVFPGVSRGAPADALGEAVFNTGMTGYEEVLTDPSYAGQIVVFTVPELGNTGFNRADRESAALHPAGLVCRRLNAPSSWRAEEPLDAALRRAARPALAGVDTRALTLHLRSRGTLKAMICCSGKMASADAVAAARAWSGLDGQDYASAVSCPAPCDWPLPGSPEPPAPAALPDGFAPAAAPAAPLVAVLDFGVKRNTLRALAALGARVRVFPAQTPAADLLAARPAGLLLSNGPGDPAALPYAIQTIRALLGELPIMGICLGHQLLALALGARTARLPFGHHGCNHPVRRLADGAVEITSQNHNFVVLEDTLDPALATVTHRNLNDGSVEGLEAPALRAFSLQYHPEAAPGPHDATPAFLRFLRTLP